MNRNIFVQFSLVSLFSGFFYFCSFFLGSVLCAEVVTEKISTGKYERSAAEEVYVAPGSKDSYYWFMSGGYSGNVTVHGIPLGRLIKTIPVFSAFAENGYGTDEETSNMVATSFGRIPWDDSHHPEISMTAGEHDGRWLFINSPQCGISIPQADEFINILEPTDRWLLCESMVVGDPGGGVPPERPTLIHMVYIYACLLQDMYMYCLEEAYATVKIGINICVKNATFLYNSIFGDSS